MRQLKWTLLPAHQVLGELAGACPLVSLFLLSTPPQPAAPNPASFRRRPLHADVPSVPESHAHDESPPKTTPDRSRQSTAVQQRRLPWLGRSCTESPWQGEKRAFDIRDVHRVCWRAAARALCLSTMQSVRHRHGPSNASAPRCEGLRCVAWNLHCSQLIQHFHDSRGSTLIHLALTCVRKLALSEGPPVVPRSPVGARGHTARRYTPYMSHSRGDLLNCPEFALVPGPLWPG